MRRFQGIGDLHRNVERLIGGDVTTDYSLDALERMIATRNLR